MYSTDVRPRVVPTAQYIVVSDNWPSGPVISDVAPQPLVGEEIQVLGLMIVRVLVWMRGHQILLFMMMQMMNLI